MRPPGRAAARIYARFSPDFLREVDALLFATNVTNKLYRLGSLEMYNFSPFDFTAEVFDDHRMLTPRCVIGLTCPRATDRTDNHD